MKQSLNLNRRTIRTIWLSGVIVITLLFLVVVKPAAAQPVTFDAQAPLPTATLTTVPGYIRYLAVPGSTDDAITPSPQSNDGSPDYAEPNWDFDRAYRSEAGDELTGLNFIPTEPGAIDNDFFVFAARPGVTYVCETRDLVGVDTNLIAYGPTLSLIGGNDDVDLLAGRVNSRLTFTPNYAGDTFVLVGYKKSPIDLATASYSLSCFVEETAAVSTPPPPASSRVCTASATPQPVQFSFTLLSEPTRQPTPPPTPLTATHIQVIVGYDENANGVLDLPEGVWGLSVRVVDTLTNRQLAQGFTDSQGTLSFIVITENEVRVLVPFLSAAREFRAGPPITWELLIPAGNQPGLIP